MNKFQEDFQDVIQDDIEEVLQFWKEYKDYSRAKDSERAATDRFNYANAGLLRLCNRMNIYRDQNNK